MIGQLLMTAMHDFHINVGKVNPHPRGQIDNLFISVRMEQTLIKKMLFQAGQDIFNGRV